MNTTMDNTHTRRQQQSSPRLLRSRSGSTTPTIILPPSSSNPNSRSSTPSNSQRFATTRSKSTVKSRAASKKDEEKVLALAQKKGQENGIIRAASNLNLNLNTSFTKLVKRGSATTSPSPRPRMSTSAPPPRSPSAWAMSPARSLPFIVAPEQSPAASTIVSRVKHSGGGGGGGGVSGVLKYFRLQKKVPPIQEEDFHRFRLLHNRLLQWRFANARAEAATLGAQKIAQDKLFSVWLRTLKVRNYILDKQMQVQKLKHEMKLCQILSPQISLLNEWGNKFEKRNQESVSRLVRKLSGISNTLPLVQDAKADTAAVYDAMTTAMVVMEGIVATVTKLLPQLEKVLYMVTELLIMQKQQIDLEKNVTLVAALVEEEASIRAHLIQIESEGAMTNIPSSYKIQIDFSHNVY